MQAKKSRSEAAMCGVFNPNRSRRKLLMKRLAVKENFLWETRDGFVSNFFAFDRPSRYRFKISMQLITTNERTTEATEVNSA
jgi:hypothetical protein